MFDVRRAADRLNALNEAEKASIAALRVQAIAEGERLAALIGERDPGVEAVFGFGSAFDHELPFRLDSDIDLAVEGGDPLLHFRLTEKSAFRVDVVQLRGSNDDFTLRIRARGRLLFHR